METKFKVGDKVKSKVEAQGLKNGATYRVVDVAIEDRGMFGMFTFYAVVPVESGRSVFTSDGVLVQNPRVKPISVGNGHLVLEAVRS